MLDKEISEIFNIDIWELKKSYNQNKAIKNIVNNDFKIVYSFDIEDSKRSVKFYISSLDKLNSFINISKALFFKSNIEIIHYINEINNIKSDNNIFIDSFILDEKFKLNSIEQKKHILNTLYDKSDFNS